MRGNKRKGFLANAEIFYCRAHKCSSLVRIGSPCEFIKKHQRKAIWFLRNDIVKRRHLAAKARQAGHGVLPILRKKVDIRNKRKACDSRKNGNPCHCKAAVERKRLNGHGLTAHIGSGQHR